MGDDLDDKRRVERALANLVTELPAKERAAVVLEDVLDCSLEETAEITRSNVGAHSVVAVSVEGNRMSHVRDYLHVDYLLRFSDVSSS